DLAGVDGDFAGLVDGEERIDFGEDDGLRRRLRQRVIERACEREADDKRAGTDERVAAGNPDVHGHLPPHVCAARWTARTMRAWVPQRQRFSASAFLMSASLGLLFLARKAAACMIMPLMQ